jgi:hypothetical protein
MEAIIHSAMCRVYSIRGNPKIRRTQILIYVYKKLTPPPLQWTLPTFAESFSTSLLPCFNFSGYQLWGNSVIGNMIHYFFKRKCLCTGQFVFLTGAAWFHLSGYNNIQNRRIWSAENPHELQENPMHSLNRFLMNSVSKKNCDTTII